MDQDLKQRLVGAVVITSLAAIFIPMLFDDPVDESGKRVSELKIPQVPANAFNPDSAKLPKNSNDVISLPRDEAIKEYAAKSADNKIERWFIQVGIFGEKSNAISLQNKIRKQGFPVTITTVSSDKGVLYRVRVGPELDQKRAELIKAKVDKLNNIKGILSSIDE